MGEGEDGAQQGPTPRRMEGGQEKEINSKRRERNRRTPKQMQRKREEAERQCVERQRKMKETTSQHACGGRDVAHGRVLRVCVQQPDVDGDVVLGAFVVNRHSAENLNELAGLAVAVHCEGKEKRNDNSVEITKQKSWVEMVGQQTPGVKSI